MGRKAFGFSSKVSRKGNWLNLSAVTYQLSAIMREMQQFLVHSSKAKTSAASLQNRLKVWQWFPYDNSAGRAAL